MAPPLPQLDPGAPERYYLPSTDLLELSDATILLEGGGGITLPVHSQKRGGSALVLSTPFSGFPLDVVALFLRLVYRMEEAAPAPTGVLDGVPFERLLGVLRLAHQLDTREVNSLPLLVAAANAAAECELGGVHTATLRRLQAVLGQPARRTAPAPVRAALAGLNRPSLVELQLLSLGARPAGGDVKQTVAFEGFAGMAAAGGRHNSAPFFAGGVGMALPSFKAGRREQGWDRFAPLAQLHDARRGFLAGDALRIEVGITVHKKGGGGGGGA
ncbi:MAG: hypothetical protein J3K34DRAFT_495383 [Monoraphidium minutum]|nr:MAG: hypothetical protein J3K34DRAFT_495383 [Monoraphidium minutum]